MKGRSILCPERPPLPNQNGLATGGWAQAVYLSVRKETKASRQEGESKWFGLLLTLKGMWGVGEILIGKGEARSLRELARCSRTMMKAGKEKRLVPRHLFTQIKQIGIKFLSNSRQTSSLAYGL